LKIDHNNASFFSPSSLEPSYGALVIRSTRQGSFLQHYIPVSAGAYYQQGSNPAEIFCNKRGQRGMEHWLVNQDKQGGTGQANTPLNRSWEP